MKNVIIFICLAIVMTFTVCGHGIAELYPACGIVIEIDYEEDLVYVQDFNGEIWCFEGTEDWTINDICGMIMDDMNTPLIFDDIIIKVRYCGWIE